jgi:lysophospholipase L1-like esterase
VPRARLVALGDSFVEGHGAGPAGGWTDQLGWLLGLPPGGVVNLGGYGATTQDVVDRQLAPALANKAPLIGLAVGVNDLLGGYHPDTFRANLDRLYSALTGPDTVVFTATYPVVPRVLALPAAFGDLVRRRFDEANGFVRELTRRHGVLCLDMAGDEEWAEPELWSHDGLHPGAEGHRRFAEQAGALVAAATGTPVEILSGGRV